MSSCGEQRSYFAEVVKYQRKCSTYKIYFYWLHLQFAQVTQLTGFSDPVYAEAYVHINQYDIVLDVLVVNQTADTLQNCTIELATLGKFVFFARCKICKPIWPKFEAYYRSLLKKMPL